MKIILIMLVFTSLLFSQKRILLDEDLDDWVEVTTFYKDPIGDNLNGTFDFDTLWVTNDNDYLYLRIQTTEEINLVDRNYLTVYFDTDNKINTGKLISGIGAEFEYTFGTRKGKSYFNTNNYFDHSSIGFIGSPTFSGNDFEFAIKLNSYISGNKLFTSDTIKIRFTSYTSSSFTAFYDQTPDTDGFEYILKYNDISPPPSFSIKKESAEYLRIMAYNIERDGIIETSNTTEYSSIFKAIEPEIIGFTEVYSASSQQVADRLEFFLPSKEGEIWYNKKEGEYDIVLISRFQITQSFTIESDIGHNASGAFLLNLRPKYDSDMLVIVSHPKCCSGVSEDEKRQNQFDAIIAFIRDAVNTGGVLTISPNIPIIVMGDLNLVGDSRQYKTLITGDIKFNDKYGNDFLPDWDSSGFDDAIPFVSNTGMCYTTNPGSFPPGRLDYLVYSGSVMKAVNSYILNTNKLTNEQISQFGFSKSNTDVSDHLPVIVDFDLTQTTNVKTKVEVPKKFGLIQNYPNPFNPSTTFRYSIQSKSTVVLKIFDALGNYIETLLDEDKSAGIYELKWDASNLASGVYFYQFQSQNFMGTNKMLLLE